LNHYHSHTTDGSEDSDTSARCDAGPRLAGGDADSLLNRLQRNGGALTPCECGSRSWLPPDGIYQLSATSPSSRVPVKAVVPLTCAACGFTKFYDPAVVASIAESTGRW